MRPMLWPPSTGDVAVSYLQSKPLGINSNGVETGKCAQKTLLSDGLRLDLGP